jgi:hypothetical protein
MGPAGASPLTTKGDLFGRNATVDARVPVGANDLLLQADSTQTLGIKWAVPTGSSIANTPSGNLAATTVQGALNELQSDVDTRVLRAGDTMTGLLTLSADPTAVLHAATKQYVDARAREGRNLVLNGDMRVAQRGTSFSVTSGMYTLDRWSISGSHAGVLTVSQQTAAHPLATGLVSMQLNPTTADTSVAAGDYALLMQQIEGYNFAAVNILSASVTISFYVWAAKAGTHYVTITSGGVDRCYCASYTVTAAGSWQRVSVTIPFSNPGGTWYFDHRTGMRLYFPLMVGSTFTAPAANTWYSAHYMAGPGQQNYLDSTSNLLYFTDVQVEVGAVATAFERIPFETTLARCQRYFWKTFNYATAPAQAVGLDTGEWNFVQSTAASTAASLGDMVFPAVMRAAPTLVTYNPVTASAVPRNRSATADCTVLTTTPTTARQSRINCTFPAGSAVGQTICLHATADAEL